MAAVKYICGYCNKSSFSQNNYLGLCSGCAKKGDAIRSLRVRTIPPPATLVAVPGESLVTKRGLASDTTAVPAIYVVEFGDNRQTVAKSSANVFLWCADPGELRKFVKAAKEMVQAAAAGFDTDSVHRITWFGAESGTRKWAAIGVKLNDLNNYFQSTLATIKFACTYGDGIAAIDPTKFDGTSASVTVLLDRGFCWRRFSDGEIICSIVHEFTHIICGTTDEKLGAVDQYGLTKCQALAVSDPDKAWKNADNLAYYICEYRANATDRATIDWACLDSVSFVARSPLGPGMPPP